VIVVKVGGSLYDHPRLGPVLRAYLKALPEPIVLVPGGGRFADAVRHLDAIHGLGAASHRLALRAMNLAGAFLTSLGVHAELFDAVAADPDVPHSWEATSDSIAAWAAAKRPASRLILLKSIDIPREMSWNEAAERGFVDAHFSSIVEKHGLLVEAVNFRRRMDASIDDCLQGNLTGRDKCR